MQKTVTAKRKMQTKYHVSSDESKVNKIDPFLDIYFSGLSVTERWKPYLYRGRICRRLSVVFTAMIELTFFILSAFKLRDTHLWYFVIPGFSIFGIFWMICHIIFLLTLWGFHSKLNDCHKVYFTHRVDNNNLDRIMASKGMRHFCLISEQLVFFSLLATAILGAVSWQVSLQFVYYVSTYDM